MNPIQLTSSDGVVYAYACGLCHHVSGGSSIMGRPPTEGPHAQLVEHSLEGAKACCLCHMCGEPVALGTWSRLWCTSCSWWQDFARVWNTLGIVVHGGFTQQTWLAYLNDDGDDDE